MLSCYIIDDEIHPVDLLRSYIDQTPELTLKGFSHQPLEGLQQLLSDTPDLLFLDVDMPGLKGTELYGLLDNRCDVIFTTAHEQYAVNAFDLSASDFLLKPIRYERFLKAVYKVLLARRRVKAVEQIAQSPFIFVQTGTKGKLVKLYLEKIIYTESLNNYLLIHTTEGSLTVYLSLREFLAQLPGGEFCRIHRSFVVNYEQIKGIEGNRVWMKGDKEVPIGVQYREDFLARVNRDVMKK